MDTLYLICVQMFYRYMYVHMYMFIPMTIRCTSNYAYYTAVCPWNMYEGVFTYVISYAFLSYVKSGLKTLGDAYLHVP